MVKFSPSDASMRDWDDETPAPAEGPGPGELVRELAQAMRRRDEAQKMAAECRQHIERLVDTLRKQHPAVVAVLTDKPSTLISGADVDLSRYPRNEPHD